MQILGIDTGGTFTDFVYFDGVAIQTHKVLSTPDAPEQAILQGINEMGLSLTAGLKIIHGSTVATNAVLEGKGARTVYITNRGFKDVLSIGRQARKELYNLKPKNNLFPLAPEYCLETGGRVNADAEVLEDLTAADLASLNTQLDELAPEAVAINLLFSYLDSSFEDQIAASMSDSLFVSVSSRLLPVYREYERGMTTWLNAYIGPLMQGYLQRLIKQLGKTRLSIMRSSGDTCDAMQAGQEAIHLLLSGPAGGLTAAHYLKGDLTRSGLLTFDMGGTSTDVALMDGEIELTGDAKIADYPVGVPMVNMHTIGAGGGSIAYVDAGGLLQVSPNSAGAKPGPACYGQGGENATVTDANLILGRIPTDIKLGEHLTMNVDAADQAISKLTQRLGLASNKETAHGIINVANEHMAQALRVISVERGIDPRQFSLMAFGGAGGLHVCELAEKLEMNHAVVPNRAGVLSAFGMLVAKPGRQFTKTVGCLLSEIDDVGIESVINEIAEQGKTALLQEGYQYEDMTLSPVLELCYRGQASALAINWTNKADAEALFHQRHQQRYGHKLETPVELVNVRVGIRVDQGLSLTDKRNNNESINSISGNVLPRSSLKTGQVLEGEMIICDLDSTTWVAGGWSASVDICGHLLLEKQ